MKKIVSLRNFKIFSQKLENKNIVLVGGCFDIFHFGHLVFLEKAKKTGDFLIIALESDKFIKKFKNRKPIHTQNQRAKILSSLKMVDLVIKLPFLSSDDEYFQMIKLIKPKIIAVTEGDPLIKNKEKQAQAINAKVKIVTPLIKKFSTSSILNRI